MIGRGDTLRPSSPAGQPSRMLRVPSHESLTAHPLLSPGPSASTFATNANGVSSTNSSPESIRVSTGSPGSASISAPKYLPYTPRQQRVPTGSATTGTTVSSPVSVSPQQLPQGGATSATSKLQLQNLKAVAQNNGLDAGSLGWEILEELVSGLDNGPAWFEIWNALATGKASLLLPRNQSISHEIITPELMKDHIVFCNGSSRNNAPAVTLSGLRLTIDENVTIRSILPTSSKSFKALVFPTTRASTLLSLAPLPDLSIPSSSFPQFLAPTHIPSLPLPPRTSIPLKPPLPPRPGTRPSALQSASRLSNPFASFFSKPSTPTTPSTAPHPSQETLQIDHVVEVSAFTIDRPIIRRTVSKALAKLIKSEIKESLAGLPSWVIDRTQNFSARFLPFPKAGRRSKDENVGSAESDTGSTSPMSAYDDPAEEVSQAFQTFYGSLEDELRAEGSPLTLRRRDERQSEEAKEKEKAEKEERIRDTLEKVERTLTCVFYDRLFQPSNSDDASHDEALSSRVAALNMLDLSLDHLGVDVGASGADVGRVVAACGETISQLEVARCPADKAAILVASHRIIVDGLSRLPPLWLKSDEVIEDEKTPQAPTFAAGIQARGDDKEQNSNPQDMSIPLPQTFPPEDAKSSIEASDTSETITTTSKARPSPSTPLLTVSPPKTPTPVSGDILLPLIIFSVVKMNPSQLVSHLLYTQRFRNQSYGGEEGYCLINLMAVVEFLENVDLGVLGLKESEKVISTADLTPIPLSQSAASMSGAHAGLRGRVEQQVDAIAGSANKVISGVVDSGFGVLRSLLPAAPGEQLNPSESISESAPWNNIRPGFGLLRRESGFSIASLAASLPGASVRDRARLFASSHHDKGEEGQEMVESRPGSVKNLNLEDDVVESEESASADDGGASEGEDEDPKHDARSIRSFESMMSGRSRSKADKKDRMSLTDRLAHMSRLTRGSTHSNEIPAHHQGSPPPRISSLLSAKDQARFDTPVSSRTSSPIPGVRSQVAPPNRRFLECTPDDLKISEIPELLREYRRLAESMRLMGVFEEYN